MSPLNFFKALADDTRLRSLLLLQREGELCVCELMAALGESQPKISRHLAQLREGGFLSSRRQGQWVFYRITENLPAWAHDQLAGTLAANSGYISADIKRLEKMGDRPQRAVDCCS